MAESTRREDELRRLSELMSDCCWIRREYPDGRSEREWVSGSFERLTGYTHEEFERIGREKLVHPEDLPEALEYVTGPPGLSEHEFRVITKGGEERWLHERMLVTRDEVGTICVYGATRDITDKKHMEEALRASREELHQSQKLEALGKLAGGIAHDFNNLLMAITGYGELLVSTLDGRGRSARYASEICEAAKRASSLTEQLLVFSRKQQLAPQVVSLNELIREMDRLLGRLLPENITIKLDLCDDLKRVEIDPGQFQQVLVNLVVNSRDAMPGGGGIDIWTAQEQSVVTVGVRDTGCGMESKTLERMFEPFFTTKGPGEGTGLGLAAVYGIVKQSGGRIEASSEPGKGTAIAIHLPEATSRSRPLDRQTGARVPERGTETLLLVEDEETVRKIVTDALRDLGYTVLAAAGPSEALEISAGHPEPIHLMITDVVMPEFDGFELARRVTTKRRGTKVLYMSGYTPDAIGDDRPDAPLLRKPFSPRVLATKIREMLD